MSFCNHKKLSFDGFTTAVNERRLAAGVNCAVLQWNKDEKLSKLKTVETDLDEFLKIVSELATEGSLMLSKQFETEIDRDC